MFGLATSCFVLFLLFVLRAFSAGGIFYQVDVCTIQLLDLKLYVKLILADTESGFLTKLYHYCLQREVCTIQLLYLMMYVNLLLVVTVYGFLIHYWVFSGVKFPIYSEEIHEVILKAMNFEWAIYKEPLSGAGY